MKKRIAVLVSGGGTNLQALIDAQQAGKIPSGEIVLVVSSQRGAYACERAAKAGIPAVVCSKKELGGTQETFEAAICAALEILKAHGEDAYVIGEIIKGEEKVILE